MLPRVSHHDPGLPRPLSEREVAILDLMLGVDDPRLDALREQSQAVRATWECTCGCATINLGVDQSRARPATGLCSPVTEARHRATYDTDEFCELILFLQDGWLSSLELVWYANPIPEFPPVDDFEPATLCC